MKFKSKSFSSIQKAEKFMAALKANLDVLWTIPLLKGFTIFKSEREIWPVTGYN